MIIDDKKLAEALKSKEITKSKLCDCGVSSRTIAKISKGENLADNVVQKIATILNISAWDIVACNEILLTLKTEKDCKVHGGLYHETQIRLTYNSNHIEGSRLTEDQTRYIFETKTLGDLPKNVALDDILQTNNHFICIDYIIEHATQPLDREFVLKLHSILMQGTTYEQKYGAGQFKRFPNTVGGIETTLPENVERELEKIVKSYNGIKNVKLEDIVEFHYNFERIHPFQDGNGRIGRLIMFKECLKCGIVPFYIDDNYKSLYYNGLREWNNEPNFLLETCRFGQDLYKRLLDYFRVKY